jgi:CHAD domain-containing protein
MPAAPEHNPCKTQYFQVQGLQPSGLLQEDICSPEFRLSPVDSRHEKQVFYDTFDWHAFEKNFAVVKKKNALFLLSLDSGIETESTIFPGYPPSFFSSDLPQGPLREQLSAVSQIRAFLKQCTIDTSVRSYRIMDDNEKTIGYLTSESLTVIDKSGRKPLAPLLSLRPFKGYQDETDAFRKLLSRHIVVEESMGFMDVFRSIMQAAGQQVQGYSSKIRLQLDPEAPVHESMRTLLQWTLSIMKANEEGIRNNTDTEYLHDYRVAVRRTRSVMKLIRGVFDPDETAPFLDGFRELGKKSNVLRDCDVYLLRQHTCFGFLPPFLKPGLEQFFAEIERSRKASHRSFCRHLASESYDRFLHDWERFVLNDTLTNPDKAPKASLSTITIAGSSIRKAWKKVIRYGRLIGPEATDRELHELRIDCKKLRYLLEFFASLYPQKTIVPIIRQLKELQENLGSFVDYSVQIMFLQERLQSVPETSGNHQYPASIGGLVSVLFMKKEETRAHFTKIFRAFDQESSRRMFRELLDNG